MGALRALLLADEIPFSHQMSISPPHIETSYQDCLDIIHKLKVEGKMPATVLKYLQRGV
jgi:hypothetical protein